MNNSAILSFFFCILLLGSCKTDPVVGPVNIDIEDEFNVLLWEKLGDNERTFFVNLETILANSCEDAEIEYTQINQSQGIFLTVNDIINDHCALGSFPAKANVDVGPLANTDYDVDINLKNVIPNTGKLTVTNDYYEINIDEPNGILIPNNRLYKVPENTIWGYVAYEDATGEVPHDDFIGELNNITTSFFATKGWYGYFEIKENNNVQVAHDLAHNYVQPFIYRYNGESNDLENLSNTFQANYPNMAFKIFTSKGEEF